MTIGWSYQDVGYTVEFTFKDAPDAAEYEILSSGTAPNQAYIEDTLIPGLLAHPDIAEFFNISVEQDTFFGFRLTSRVDGPISLTGAAVGIAASSASTTGVAGVRETDYLASAWLYVAQEYNSPFNEFTKLGEFELYPDADNKAEIDLQQLLDDTFTEPETPTATTNAPVLCTKLTRDFFVLYGQKFGNPVDRKNQTRTAVFRAIKAGMTHSEFLSSAAKLNFTTTGWRFLTLRMRREVSEAQKDWLFIHAGPTALSSGSLNYQLFYTDGTTASGQLWSGRALLAGNTYQMAAGYTQAGLKTIADAASKTAYKYTLQVGGVGGASALSEKATFYIMPYDHLEVVVQFENSLGGIDSWRFTGSRALSGNITAEHYRRSLPGGAAADFQQLLSFNEQDQPTITLSTGPLGKSDALAFRDFLRSRHKWITKGTARIPFITNAQEYSVDQESTEADYTRSFTFTAVLAPERAVSIGDPVWPS